MDHGFKRWPIGHPFQYCVSTGGGKHRFVEFLFLYISEWVRSLRMAQGDFNLDGKTDLAVAN